MAPAQSHRAALSFPSSNGKTGPIAVSSSSRLTCPSSCPLAGDRGCYAEAGFQTRLHWDRLSRGESGLPAVFRHEGVRFVACLTSRSGRKVQCINCGGRFGLPHYAQADRGFVITFPAHGARSAAAAAHCS